MSGIVKMFWYMGVFIGFAFLSVSSGIAEVGFLQFQDVHLGMSAVDFARRHPVIHGRINAVSPTPPPEAATCYKSFSQVHLSSETELTHGAASCIFDRAVGDAAMQLRVTVFFYEGRAVVIELRFPMNTGMCWVEPPAPNTEDAARFAANCDRFAKIRSDLADGLRGADSKEQQTNNPQHLPVRIWETERSVAQMEPAMCGPWDGTAAGWSYAIAEVLDNRFCSVADDRVSSQIPIVLYVDKNQARLLAAELAKGAGDR
jgi:hypothetical protein